MAKKVFLETRSEPILLTLVGISSHIKDFQLSFHLNQNLELEFVKKDDFKGCSFYLSNDEDRYNTYYLLGNRGQDAVLLPELKQTDFLLLVEGPFKKAQKEQLLAKIRSVKNVLTAFEVRFETIKNYELMLTDLELHHMNIVMDAKIKYSPVK
jgi:hypothetical protein